MFAGFATPVSVSNSPIQPIGVSIILITSAAVISQDAQGTHTHTHTHTRKKKKKQKKKH